MANETEKKTVLTLEKGDVALVWRADSDQYEFVIPNQEDDDPVPTAEVLMLALVGNAENTEFIKTAYAWFQEQLDKANAESETIP